VNTGGPSESGAGNPRGATPVGATHASPLPANPAPTRYQAARAAQSANFVGVTPSSLAVPAMSAL
jgi:hypothetical protein